MGGSIVCGSGSSGAGESSSSTSRSQRELCRTIELACDVADHEFRIEWSLRVGAAAARAGADRLYPIITGEHMEEL
jgi:hypothetical protein